MYEVICIFLIISDAEYLLIVVHSLLDFFCEWHIGVLCIECWTVVLPTIYLASSVKEAFLLTLGSQLLPPFLFHTTVCTQVFIWQTSPR